MEFISISVRGKGNLEGGTFRGAYVTFVLGWSDKRENKLPLVFAPHMYNGVDGVGVASAVASTVGVVVDDGTCGASEEEVNNRVRGQLFIARRRVVARIACRASILSSFIYINNTELK
jgi:hypothetical protein